MFLIAPKLDQLLGREVYSYRLKQQIQKKDEIFKKSSMVSIPFLKTKTIRAKLDPFDPWYENWPEFDSESRKGFPSGKYRYLATSDIAAYFENIQLPILRDQLLGRLSEDPKIVNLLFEFLDFWAERTEAGRPHLRGIPQGNIVSSFLGNVFLIPLDESFRHFSRNGRIRYLRYMDDVRVFTKTMTDARFAIFQMDRVLRSLHLNVQSAKTKIHDERRGEITRTLVDSRVDDLSDFINEQMKKWKGKSPPKTEKMKLEQRLNKIAKKRPHGRAPLLGARVPLSGLSLRAFQRWIVAHNAIGSHKYIPRLLKEIEINPESRLIKRLMTCARQFPRNSSIERRLMKFIKSKENIFKHQEAESLRAIRYLSHISEETISHCKQRITSRAENSYLRVQCSYLLSRTLLSQFDLDVFSRHFASEQDPQVQTAICGLLVQDINRNAEIVDNIAFHPNESVRDVGKLFHRMRTDYEFSKAKLGHMLDSEFDWVICDHMSLLHVASLAENPKIRQHLKEKLEKKRKKISLVGLRPVLEILYNRANGI